MVVDGKSSQGYPINAGVPQGSILGPTLFLLYINNLDDVICDIAIHADDTTLCSNVMRPDLWQQLELASELESNLRGTRLGQEALLISMLGKINWFPLTDLIALVLLM